MDRSSQTFSGRLAGNVLGTSRPPCGQPYSCMIIRNMRKRITAAHGSILIRKVMSVLHIDLAQFLTNFGRLPDTVLPLAITLKKLYIPDHDTIFLFPEDEAMDDPWIFHTVPCRIQTIKLLFPLSAIQRKTQKLTFPPEDSLIKTGLSPAFYEWRRYSLHTHVLPTYTEIH